MKWAWVCLRGTQYIPSERPEMPTSNFQVLDAFNSPLGLGSSQPWSAAHLAAFRCALVLSCVSRGTWDALGTQGCLHQLCRSFWKDPGKGSLGPGWGFWAVFVREIWSSGNPNQQPEAVGWEWASPLDLEDSASWRERSAAVGRWGQSESVLRSSRLRVRSPLAEVSRWFWCQALY